MSTRYSDLESIPEYEDIEVDDYLAVETWSSGTTFQGLSFRYYGTITLWWAIAYANNIKNPLDHIEVGTRIVIPRRMYITGEV
jgi:hypothetical protein